ncbi:MAG: hypothetical protein IKW60_04655 [Clostridia bacterium]|nr:hypothetical protein [Clostridia bacterium]
MKKRMISLLLAMVMLFSITPVMLVSAALTTTTFDSALNGLWKWNGSGWKVSGKTAEIVQSAGVDGSAALHIVGNSDAGNAANSFQVVSATALTKDNTYKVTFYAKNVTNLQNAKVCFGDWGQSALDVNASYAEDMGDGWYKFTFEKTVSSNVEFAFVCLTDTDGSYATYEELEFYVDKISIVNTADNSELLSYFAANFNEEPVATPEPTVAPESTAIPEPSRAPLTTTTLDSTLNGLWKWNGSGWKVNGKTAEIVQGAGVDGSAALHIVGNSDAGNAANAFQVVSATNLTAGNTYRVTFYAKDVKNLANVKICFGNYTQEALDVNAQYAEAAADGWYKFTFERTVGNNIEFAFACYTDTDGSYATYEELEIYVDKISIVNTADNSELLSYFAANFNEEPVATPAPTTAPEPTAAPESTATPAPTAAPTVDFTDVDGETAYNASHWALAGKPQNVNHKIMVSPTVGYESDKSLHVRYTKGASQDSMQLKTVVQPVVGETYTIKLYVKMVVGSADNIKFFDLWKTSYGTTPLSNTGAWQATDKGDGWVEYVSIGTAQTEVAGGTADFSFILYGDGLEFYLDKVSIVRQSDNVDLLAGEAGDFEVVLTREEKIEALLPGTAEEAFLGGADWGTDTKHNNDQYKNYIKLSSDEAYAGGRSAHVLIPVADNAEGFQFSSKHLITQAGSYTVTMYAKIVKGDASKINLFTLGTWKQPAISTLTIEPTDKDGWYKYSQTVNVTSVANNLQFALVLPAATDLDLYIDNVSVVVNGVNVLPDAASTFEPATIPAEGYTATVTKLYSVDDAITTATEITELNAVDSGKTIIATATVANYAKGDNFTGQMILCFFDGDELKLARLGDVITIKETDSATKISCIMDMPEFTDVTNLKVKAFLWDSLEGMMPLNRVLEI